MVISCEEGVGRAAGGSSYRHCAAMMARRSLASRSRTEGWASSGTRVPPFILPAYAESATTHSARSSSALANASTSRRALDVGPEDPGDCDGLDGRGRPCECSRVRPCGGVDDLETDATSLLRPGVDIFKVKRLLGRAKLVASERS